jgi:hypothetical protein
MRFDTRVPQKMGQLDQDLFFLSCDFVGSQVLDVAANAGSSQSITLTVDQDAHLLLVGASHVATDAAQTTDVPDASTFVLATLKMSSSGRDLMNNAQHLRNISGSGKEPCVWPRPKFLVAGSSMRVTLQNLSAAQRAIRLTFFAFKLFK